jgi:serine/threonine protein kinase
MLQELLDDQLSPPIEATLESHVSQCPACQQALEKMTAETRARWPDATGMDESAFTANPTLLNPPGFVPPRPSAGAPVPAALPQLPGYQVLGELGRGGMGIVYRARQLLLNRIVALKMLRAGLHAETTDRARFQAEGEAVARLHHPNIVQIYEVGIADGQPYFALEFVDGGTLARRIDGIPQPARPAAELVETVARAIHAAHERGILHRDLKPSNILIADSPAGQSAIPKITDFGLAKFLDHDSDLTQSRDIIGTPSYMAPEQATGGSSAISPATDIYALGAILYEMLTGRPPFCAESPYETVLQVVQEEPVPPAQLQRKVPRDLETICMKCLQKEPKQRYPSALALAEDLRRFLNGEPIQARPISLVRRAAKWARRRPVLAGLLAAVVFLTVLALASLSELSPRRAVLLYRDLGRRFAALGHRPGQAGRTSAATETTAQCDRGGTQFPGADGRV